MNTRWVQEPLYTSLLRFLHSNTAVDPMQRRNNPPPIDLVSFHFCSKCGSSSWSCMRELQALYRLSLKQPHSTANFGPFFLNAIELAHQKNICPAHPGKACAPRSWGLSRSKSSLMVLPHPLVLEASFLLINLFLFF